MPVEIAGGSALNWRYFFPIDTAGTGQYTFAPNDASVDAKYKSLLGTNVTTTISNSEVITAGRLSGGNFWFMATDKAAANINYTSQTAVSGGLNVRFDSGYASYVNGFETANQTLGNPFAITINNNNNNTK